MRKMIHEQSSLVEPKIHHEHAKELSRIHQIIDANPQIAKWICDDLTRGIKNLETGRKGRMSAEQVFKALLVKQMNGFSYEVLAFHLGDSRTYRAFCGFGFADGTPSRTALARDIKRIRPETLEKINRVLLAAAADKKIEKGRKVRADCTVVESNIHHPTDSTLLEDGVRVLCRLTQEAKGLVDVPVVDHRRRAKKRALGILNAKKNKVRVKLYRDLLKVARKVVRNAQAVSKTLTGASMIDPIFGLSLEAELRRCIPLVLRVIDQTERRVLQGEKVPAEEKIVSIFEPHTDVIVKDRRETCFGHKITLTGGTSGLIADLVIENGNPADATLAKRMIARQVEIYGRPPRQAAFDGGFASKDNLVDIKELGVKDVAFHKKRGLKIADMAKSAWVYKRLRNFRAGIEGMISFLKRCFGMDRCTWSGLESFKSYAWASVVTANLLLIARHLIG